MHTVRPSRTFLAIASIAVLCSCRHGPAESPAASPAASPAQTSGEKAAQTTREAAPGAAVAPVTDRSRPGHSMARLTDPPTAPLEMLKHPADFASLRDRKARSVALFSEASKVLLHPRCANCHPSDDTPRQGDRQLMHDPPVLRGKDDHGIAAMRCDSCHQDHNLPQARVPGAPKWGLAPLEMAWIGHTPGQICVQLKDRKRNGGKSLEEIQHHMAHDELVAWGWSPGWGRTPAPGTQAELGDLIRAWIDTGAECPPEEVRR